MSGRITEIARHTDGAARANAYSELDYRISNNETAPLSQEEAEALANHASKESDLLARTFMWRLLLRAPRANRIKDLALASLRDLRNPHRGFALQYLRVQYPEQMEALRVAYGHDPDPEVRYQLAKHVETTDPSAAIDQMIDILPCDSHQLGDTLWLEISEGGNAEHLRKLTKLDEAGGGGTVFAEVADSLARRLRAASQR